jgi:hypothetical protein
MMEFSVVLIYIVIYYTGTFLWGKYSFVHCTMHEATLVKMKASKNMCYSSILCSVFEMFFFFYKNIIRGKQCVNIFW